MHDAELTNHLLIPVLYLRSLSWALKNSLTYQSISFSSPLPTWIISALSFNAEDICLLYQNPPTPYTNELAGYCLKARDSLTVHFLRDEKMHCTEKKKKNPALLVHYLAKTQRWLNPELNSLPITNSAICNRTGWANKAGLSLKLPPRYCNFWLQKSQSL